MEENINEEVKKEPEMKYENVAQSEEEQKIIDLQKKVEEQKNEILRRAKQILPEGYLQMRTVMVNYETETRNSKIINEKDVIVIRGKGKFEIFEILGETKKGKIALNVEHYI